ncbi:uncharacterized protein K489DRAFT_381885 [Dissoconium aciculare CBS 342.82]|uniref:Uncharacterized protein n=1 Tax=Dissoconium aciculare CBS 342.82 TaxID=1314786 RepID=A0A6J3M1H3_9PEZI|nr:uncharacterized protein K489DRAFT_381885 [Dissoconium aciculare CBS 342.82]KAF1821880.1 hypothetical protein K489DRAFT_381885 [Dissoconium aciculare CBS 342.82]
MSTSNVGNAQVYEAGDQRTVADAEIERQKKEQRFEEGKENSHKAGDPKDERSIANRLEKEANKKDEDNDSNETKLHKLDATAPARAHGNEPSKGAKIDQELREEEEAILKKKGAFGPKDS